MKKKKNTSFYGLYCISNCREMLLFNFNFLKRKKFAVFESICWTFLKPFLNLNSFNYTSELFSHVTFKTFASFLFIEKVSSITFLFKYAFFCNQLADVKKINQTKFYLTFLGLYISLYCYDTLFSSWSLVNFFCPRLWSNKLQNRCCK